MVSKNESTVVAQTPAIIVLTKKMQNIIMSRQAKIMSKRLKSDSNHQMMLRKNI